MAEGQATPAIETWLYLGQLQQAGKLYAVWKDEQGDQHLFSKSSAIVGCLYQVDVTRNGEHLTLHGRPKFLRQVEDEDLRKQLNADHALHVTRHRAEQLAGKEGSALDNLTVRELRARFRTLPVPSRRALLAVLLSRLEVG